MAFSQLDDYSVQTQQYICNGPFADSGSMLTTRAVSILPNHPVSMLTARVVSIPVRPVGEYDDCPGSMLTAQAVYKQPTFFLTARLLTQAVSILPGPFVDCWSGKYTTDVELQCVVLENAGHAKSMLRRK